MTAREAVLDAALRDLSDCHPDNPLWGYFVGNARAALAMPEEPDLCRDACLRIAQLTCGGDAGGHSDLSARVAAYAAASCALDGVAVQS